MELDETSHEAGVLYRAYISAIGEGDPTERSRIWENVARAARESLYDDPSSLYLLEDVALKALEKQQEEDPHDYSPAIYKVKEAIELIKKSVGLSDPKQAVDVKSKDCYMVNYIGQACSKERGDVDQNT